MARPGFSLDRKFKRLARALDDVQAGFGEILARGSLELLWDSAYEACEDYLGDAEDVEAMAHWGGKAGSLVAALLAAGGEGRSGFIEEGGSPWWTEGKAGTYRIHDLWDHAPDYAKKRLEREADREAKGKTISGLRSEAGKRGAATTHGKKKASGGQGSGNGQANGGRLPEEPEQTDAEQKANGGERPADVGQFARTLAPTLAPAPAPKDPPLPRASRLPTKDEAYSAEQPRTAALLAALAVRGTPGAWPRDKDTRASVEALIGTQHIEAVADRVSASIVALGKPWLGFHTDAIRAPVAPRSGRGDRWQDRLTPEEFHQAHAELSALHPDLADAPLGCTGDPAIHPVEAIRELNERWRAVAEAR